MDQHRCGQCGALLVAGIRGSAGWTEDPDADGHPIDSSPELLGCRSCGSAWVLNDEGDYERLP